MEKIAYSPEHGYAKSCLNDGPKIAQTFATIERVHFTQSQSQDDACLRI